MRWSQPAMEAPHTMVNSLCADNGIEPLRILSEKPTAVLMKPVQVVDHSIHHAELLN